MGRELKICIMVFHNQWFLYFTFLTILVFHNQWILYLISLTIQWILYWTSPTIHSKYFYFPYKSDKIFLICSYGKDNLGVLREWFVRGKPIYASMCITVEAKLITKW